jgi:hypothetical protein
VTREEAERRCAGLNAENDDRGRRWIVQQHDNDWRVVRVSIPGLRGIKPLKATVEAKPLPPQPDPRPLVNPDHAGA